jgi:pyrroline-5-carboxylate reductase
MPLATSSVPSSFHGVNHFFSFPVQHAQTIILAVKPDVVPTVLRQIAAKVTRNHLIISIAAGVTIRTIQHVGTSKAPAHGAVGMMPSREQNQVAEDETNP